MSYSSLRAQPAASSPSRTHLQNASAIVFEPYYPYHAYSKSWAGTEVLQLHGQNLVDGDELRGRCRDLKNAGSFPLRAIILCTPVNPTGKVFTRRELEIVANACQEFDLLCIADEVYEHYVEGAEAHLSIATLQGMWDRTITVNSFSKSWNISGWRLGYAYGNSKLIAPLNNANNVFYVCSPTPLQRALAEVLVADPAYYANLRARFVRKRLRPGVWSVRRIYDSSSTFYLGAPERGTYAVQ